MYAPKFHAHVPACEFAETRRSQEGYLPNSECSLASLTLEVEIPRSVQIMGEVGSRLLGRPTL